MSREWEATNWEKIIAKDIPDKVLLFRIYKKLLKLSNKLKNQLKNSLKTLVDTSPKKIYRGQIRIWKDPPHHISLGN